MAEWDRRFFLADNWFLARDEKVGSEFWDLSFGGNRSGVFRRIEVRVPPANRKERVVSHPTMDFMTILDFSRSLTPYQDGAPPR
jgi:hypothetical protein